MCALAETRSIALSGKRGADHTLPSAAVYRKVASLTMRTPPISSAWRPFFAQRPSIFEPSLRRIEIPVTPSLSIRSTRSMSDSPAGRGYRTVSNCCVPAPFHEAWTSTARSDLPPVFRTERWIGFRPTHTSRQRLDGSPLHRGRGHLGSPAQGGPRDALTRGPHWPIISSPEPSGAPGRGHRRSTHRGVPFRRPPPRCLPASRRSASPRTPPAACSPGSNAAACGCTRPR